MDTPVPTEPPDLPHSGDERSLLLAFLDVFRFEFLDRAAGLSFEQLRQIHPPSTLNLARLLGHMTLVEHIWFRQRFAGLDAPELYQSLDWEADPDAEMTRAEGLDPDELRAEYQAAVAESNRHIAAALSLDVVAVAVPDGVEAWNLRWILIHMIEEYARHCGHADLIRESIDGRLAIP